MRPASILAARGHLLTASVRAIPRRHVTRVRNPSASGLSQPLERLRSILTMDERHRAEELAYHSTHLLIEGLRQSRYGKIASKLEDDNDVEAAIWAVHNEDPSWLKSWAADATDDILRGDPYDAPSFLFFDAPAAKRDAWLVHFSDHAERIESRGFTRGVDDPMRLGLTTGVSDSGKSQPGYVFSFLPESVNRYAFTRGQPKYGRGAVVFRSDALVAWHGSDEEQQAISWGPEAKDIVSVTMDGRSPCVYVDDEDMCFDDFPSLIEYLSSRKHRNPSRRPKKSQQRKRR